MRSAASSGRGAQLRRPRPDCRRGLAEHRRHAPDLTWLLTARFGTSSLRVILILLALCILAMAFDTRAEAQSRTATVAGEPAEVVFVCEHGSVKSLVAMEQFNRETHERGLPYHAVARGIAPERVVPEAVRAGLRADGFETSDFVPQLLTSSDVDHAVLVVSFDQDISKVTAGKVRYLTWDNLPGVLADYPRGRAAIVARINLLVDELARGNVQ